MYAAASSDCHAKMPVCTGALKLQFIAKSKFLRSSTAYTPRSSDKPLIVERGALTSYLCVFIIRISQYQPVLFIYALNRQNLINRRYHFSVSFLFITHCCFVLIIFGMLRERDPNKRFAVFYGPFIIDNGVNK